MDVCRVGTILHLEVIFNFPSKVSDGKCQLCVWRRFKKGVVVILLLQLVHQGFICGLREAEGTHRGQHIHLHMGYMRKEPDSNKGVCEQ